MELSIINVIIFLLIIATIVLSVYSLINTMGNRGKGGKGGGPSPSPPGPLPPASPCPPSPPSSPGSQTADTWYNIFQVYPNEVNKGDNPGYGYRDKLESIKFDESKSKFKTRLSDRVATALWLDSIEHSKARFINALEWMKKNGKTNIIVIVYNVPNRDCHAVASNGELCCSKTSEGYCDPKTQTEFQKETKKCLQLESTGDGKSYQDYIDGIKNTINNYCDINFKLIIEPDCFSNIITNSGFADEEPKNQCGANTSKLSYLPGIHYAITQLGECGNAELFLDVAHPLWLGWDMGIFDGDSKGLTSTLLGGKKINSKFTKLQKPDDDIINLLGPKFQYDTTTWVNYLSGFAINVSNYIPLGDDKTFNKSIEVGNIPDIPQNTPCNNKPSSNPITNLRNYAALLRYLFKGKMKDGKDPIIYADTSRNGRMDKQYSHNQTVGISEPCASWCNVFGNFGPTIGEPTFKENGEFNQFSEQDYLYLMYCKPPGESDGCVNPDVQTQKQSPQETAGSASPKACNPNEQNGTCARFDTMCGIKGTRGYNDGTDTDTDMAICPPEAGQWDDIQMKRLINNFKQ